MLYGIHVVSGDAAMVHMDNRQIRDEERVVVGITLYLLEIKTNLDLNLNRRFAETAKTYSDRSELLSQIRTVGRMRRTVRPCRPVAGLPPLWTRRTAWAGLAARDPSSHSR